jgi:anti-sigma B factor antagonist/stage II sporulation protein AA (anti-sigma F factor antagonist)
VTEFEVWADSGVALVEPCGVLDVDAVPRLRAALSEAVNLTRRPLVVVVDEKVTKVDAVALAVILIEHRRLRDRDGGLGVVGAQGPIADMLQRTHVGREVPVFATLEEALAGLATPSPKP